MKTLILNGSPRRAGDTSSLIGKVTEGLKGDIKIVHAYFDDIHPCMDCRYCRENAGCSIQDAMGSVYDYIEECDNILIASPIYYSELTGQLLSVASRLQTYFCARHFRGEIPIAKPKKGAVILVGGGDGSTKKPYETACTLLHQMNARQIFPLVASHHTDLKPAIEDAQALAGIEDIVRFFNES